MLNLAHQHCHHHQRCMAFILRRTIRARSPSRSTSPGWFGTVISLMAVSLKDPPCGEAGITTQEGGWPAGQSVAWNTGVNAGNAPGCSNSRSLALYLIYKHFLSKIERCLIKNIFINHLYKTKRPGIAARLPCCFSREYRVLTGIPAALARTARFSGLLCGSIPAFFSIPPQIGPRRLRGHRLLTGARANANSSRGGSFSQKPNTAPTSPYRSPAGHRPPSGRGPREWMLFPRPSRTRPRPVKTRCWSCSFRVAVH